MIHWWLDSVLGSFWLSEPATSAAARTDYVFFFIFWVSAFFFALIAGLMTLFIIKYHRRPGVVMQKTASHSTALEVTWSVIPLALMVVFFWLGFSTYLDQQTPPSNAYEIQVQGQKWDWFFEYPNGHVERSVLHVPSDQPVRLVITSVDVLHSLFIPDFRLKRDAVPGRFTSIWFDPAEPGEYPLYCAEYCGVGHSAMTGTVVVHAPGEFEQWLEQASQSWLETLSDEQLDFWLRTQDPKALLAKYPGLAQVADKIETPAERGRQVYLRNGCVQCHSVDGSARVGPSLKGIWGRTTSGGTTLADGRKLGDLLGPDLSPEEYVRESLMDPPAQVVKGYLPQMQSYKGRISDREIQALISYFKTLEDGGAAAAD